MSWWVGSPNGAAVHAFTGKTLIRTLCGQRFDGVGVSATRSESFATTENDLQAVMECGTCRRIAQRRAAA